jgi:hypothetical protein
MVCHFINSDSSVFQNHGTGVLNIAVSNGCGWASCSFVVLQARPTMLEFLDPFAVVKHYPHIVLIVFCGFQLLVHLQTTIKRITPNCSSLVHTESGAAILFCHSAKANGVMMLKLSTTGHKGTIC